MAGAGQAEKGFEIIFDESYKIGSRNIKILEIFQPPLRYVFQLPVQSDGEVIVEKFLGDGMHCFVFKLKWKPEAPKMGAHEGEELALIRYKKPVLAEIVQHAEILERVGELRGRAVFQDREGKLILIGLLACFHPGETLGSFLREEKLALMERLKIIFRLFCSLKTLHDQRVMHRDLSKNNVLVLRREKGFSVSIVDCADAVLDQEVKWDIWDFTTFEYAAPEVAAQTARVHHTLRVLEPGTALKDSRNGQIFVLQGEAECAYRWAGQAEVRSIPFTFKGEGGGVKLTEAMTASLLLKVLCDAKERGCEVHGLREYSLAGDVFSAGMLALTIALGVYPKEFIKIVGARESDWSFNQYDYNQLPFLQSKICRSYEGALSAEGSMQLAYLLIQMVHSNPRERPVSSVIVEQLTEILMAVRPAGQVLSRPCVEAWSDCGVHGGAVL